MPMGEDDLKKLRDKVKERLGELKEGKTIVINNHREPQSLYCKDTKGWCANIGWLNQRHTGLEKISLKIYLDELYHNNYKISYFVETENEDTLLKFLDRIQHIELFGPIVRTIYEEKDWKTDKYQLKDPLIKKDFNKTFLELYPNKSAFYYGKCDSSLRINEKLVDRIVSFYLDIGHAIAVNPVNDNDDQYSALENRRLATKHIQRERNSNLSNQRKIRDDYQCKICGLKFEEIYGIIGRNFAEAHHIIPLAQLETTQRNTIDDLITVCANCHRMLHKLDGEEEDIEYLKELINEDYLDSIYLINEE